MIFDELRSASIDIRFDPIWLIFDSIDTRFDSFRLIFDSIWYDWCWISFLWFRSATINIRSALIDIRSASVNIRSNSIRFDRLRLIFDPIRLMFDQLRFILDQLWSIHSSKKLDLLNLRYEWSRKDSYKIVSMRSTLQTREKVVITSAATEIYYKQKLTIL